MDNHNQRRFSLSVAVEYLATHVGKLLHFGFTELTRFFHTVEPNKRAILEPGNRHAIRRQRVGILDVLEEYSALSRR